MEGFLRACRPCDHDARSCGWWGALTDTYFDFSCCPSSRIERPCGRTSMQYRRDVYAHPRARTCALRPHELDIVICRLGGSWCLVVTCVGLPSCPVVACHTMCTCTMIQYSVQQPSPICRELISFRENLTDRAALHLSTPTGLTYHTAPFLFFIADLSDVVRPAVVPVPHLPPSDEQTCESVSFFWRHVL